MKKSSRSYFWLGLTLFALALVFAVFFRKQPSNEGPTSEITSVTKEMPKADPQESVAPQPSIVSGSSPAKKISERKTADSTNQNPKILSDDLPQSLSVQQFERLAKQALETMPKTSEVQKLPPEETHHIPPLVLAKIQILAKLVGAVADNPQLEPAAINFYNQCARQKDLLVTIRARCLTHLKELAIKNNARVDFDSFPEDVKRLASLIP